MKKVMYSALVLVTVSCSNKKKNVKKEASEDEEFEDDIAFLLPNCISTIASDL